MEELMKRRILPQLVAASVACLLAGAVNAAGVLAPDSDEDDLVPNGKGWGERAYPAHPNGYGNGNANGQGTRKVGSGISYHGGPIMLGTTNVYYIWYGDWGGNSATTILADLANHIGGSPYYNINTTYYNGANTHVSNSVAFAGSTTDNYSNGTALTDSGVQAVVSSAIMSGRLPKDTDGVYF